MAALTLPGVLLTGDHASRPAATAVGTGTLYACSTHSLIYQSDGASWSTWATLGGTVSEILDLPTAETDDSLVLAPDGAGGVEFRAEAGGSGGALVLLEQHTASSSAQIDFDSFISSTYDEYQFEFLQVIPATNNVDFLMRMGTGGGPTYDTGNNYSWTQFRWVTNASAPGGFAGVSSIGLSTQVDHLSNSANWGYCGTARLYNPASSIYKRVTYQGSYLTAGSARQSAVGDGAYEVSTAVTAIRFLFSSGNIASGTIRAYGIAK